MSNEQTHDKSERSYLCFAWGESDLPAAVIARSRAEVLKFMVDEWFGEQPDKMCAANHEQWTAAVEEFDAHDWREDGPLEWQFEIGGVRITEVGAALQPSTLPSIPLDLIDALRRQNPHDTDEVIKLMNAAARWIESLRAFPSARGEPVAWRYRFCENGTWRDWQVSIGRPAAHGITELFGNPFEQEPLYASTDEGSNHAA